MSGRMKAAAVAAAMAVMAAGLSCKGTAPTGPDGSPSTIVFPVNGVSYGAQVQPLFNQACNPVGCHDAGQHQSQLDLTTYDQAVLALPGVVVAGKPDASTLVLRIQGSVGARMPPGNYPLNQNQINGIRTWIVEGAKNN